MDSRSGRSRKYGGLPRSLAPVLPLGLLLAASAVHRVLVLLAYFRDLPYAASPPGDAAIYLEWARRIAHGDWLSRGEGVFYRAPLYPYFLAGWLRAVGDAQPAAQWIQLGLGLGTLILVWKVALRLAGRTAALVAAILLTLYGPLLSMESKLLPTVLGIFLQTGFLLLLAGWLDRPSLRRGLAAGALLGLSALVRPPWIALAVVLPFLLPSVAWRARVRSWIPVWLGLALVVLPVTVRNRVIGGDWTLISSNGGMTFYQGNNEENHTGLLTLISRFELFGSASLQQAREVSLAREETGHPLGPAGASTYWAGRGLHFITGHPLAWLVLEARKLFRLVGSFEPADHPSFEQERQRIPLLWLAFVPFGLILALGVLGSAPERAANRSLHRLLLAGAAFALSGCLVFYVNSRYRMEAAPALAILGGACLVRARSHLDRLKARDVATWISTALALLVLCFTFLSPGRAARAQESASLLELGRAFQNQGRAEEARGAFTRARTVVPGNVFAWNAEALLLARSGRVEEADSLLASAPRDPVGVHPLTLFSRALLCRQKGNTEEEGGLLRAALQGNPLLLDARLELARLYETRREYARASEEMAAAAIQRPDDAELLSRLAYLRIRARDFEGGRTAVLGSLRIQPSDSEAWINLAAASFHLGDLDETERALGRVRALASTDSAAAEDPLVLYYGGLTAWRRGDAAQAATLLGRLAALEPDQRRAVYYLSLARRRLDLRGTAGRDTLLAAPWLAAYGEEIRHDLALLDRWLDLRSRAAWGSMPDPGSDALLRRLESSGPTGATLTDDLRRFLDEERDPGARAAR